MTGEVGITMKSIDSFFDPTDYWPSPTFLTNDNLLDWQIDIDADAFNGVVRAVWVKPSSYVPPEFDPPFGKGLDAIQLIEIPLGPDVGISPGEASLSTPYPQEEDVVTIRARVRNVGTRDVESVSVGFYLDSVEPGNLVDSASISNLRYQRLNLVTGQWISDGQAHTIIVFADNGSSTARD